MPSIRIPDPLPRVDDPPFSTGNKLSKNEIVYAKQNTLQPTVSLIAEEENNGSKYYYCYDSHGDVKLLTYSSRNVVKNYVYNIYGKENNSTQNQGIENSIRYAGQYYDA